MSSSLRRIRVDSCRCLGTIFRFTIISFLYGFFLLVLPWLGKINERNIRGEQRTGLVKVHRLNDVRLVRYRAYILVLGLISLLTVLAQIIFQSVLLSKKPYGHTLSNCTFEILPSVKEPSSSA